MNPNENPLPPDDVNLLSLLSTNQLKMMAQSQVLLIQQARLISHLTENPLSKIMDQADEIYRQELNKLHLAHLAELRALQGKPSSTNSGGGLGGTG